MLPKESPINHQTAYFQPPVHTQIEAKEADVQAISKLTHALGKKVVISITLSVSFVFCLNYLLRYSSCNIIECPVESLPSYFRKT